MTAEPVGWTSARGSALTSFPEPETHTHIREECGLAEMDITLAS